MFYAYDDIEHQSERVVSYRLKGKKNLKKLMDGVNLKNLQFVVHLGLYKTDLNDRIPLDPALTIFLQVSSDGGDCLGESIELKWEKNSRFSKTMEDNTDSGRNAISAASAYLFVKSWMEMPEALLAAPFTASSRVLGKRVKSYIYSVEESRSIYTDLQLSNENCLDIHLGSGLAVWDHPFSFRPVLEVKGVVGEGENRQVPMNATGPLNDDGDSFYDFSWPNPPGEP